MIPTNIPEMATMLYMMEVNEWGAENLNDKLANDLAEASFDAAEVFFEVKGTRAADRLQAVKDKVRACKEAKKGEQGRGEDYALGKSVKLQTED